MGFQLRHRSDAGWNVGLTCVTVVVCSAICDAFNLWQQRAGSHSGLLHTTNICWANVVKQLSQQGEKHLTANKETRMKNEWTKVSSQSWNNADIQHLPCWNRTPIQLHQVSADHEQAVPSGGRWGPACEPVAWHHSTTKQSLWEWHWVELWRRHWYEHKLHYRAEAELTSERKLKVWKKEKGT